LDWAKNLLPILITNGNEMMSELWGGNMGFNYFKMFNPVIINGIMDNIDEINQIEERQSRIDTFFNNRQLLSNVVSDLSNILDVERLSGRIAMQKAHAKDLQALKNSLLLWTKIKSYLNQHDFSLLETETSDKICQLIANSILDDPATSLTDGGIIKQGWSEELDKWRDIHNNFNKILSEYEQEEKEKTGISTLRIKYTGASGYFIEVSKGKISSIPSHFIMRRALVNGERYTTEKLQELEKQLNESSVKILELERDLFIEVRDSLIQFIPYLLQISSEIANTDVISSLTLAAIENNWQKPIVDESTEFEIIEGRHPVVEKHIPIGEFVPNNSKLNSDDENLPSFNLITGPNMAGKSTYLRQNALICLLAQIGSFVPAKSAKIGIVDKIFCRVGASDNLAKGESTFLVEMTETAHILHSATKRSLVIMDEVGRGTSTEDGLAIARAVSEHLLDEIQCRTLFATHYHELSRMEHKKLNLLCMDVSEQNGSVVFLRKVKEGASENSYGIHVASLAGIPQCVINRANVILNHIQQMASENPFVLEETEKVLSKSKETVAPVLNTPGLFSDEEIIISEILSVDTDNITPINALQTITRWKKALSGQ
jgi:DNA mismatch repair protein MutS